MLRARQPDETGFVEQNGIRLYWERFGAGEQTIFFLPTWSIIHSRFWKFQIPYFARHFRVLTFDGRGNGKSDRPKEPAAYAEEEFAADALAVMDATGTEQAALVSFSLGAQRALLLAANHADCVAAAAFIGPYVPLGSPLPERSVYPFDEPLETEEGWAKYNKDYWLRDYPDFLEFFFSKMFAEPHSTKQIDDC